MYGRMWQTPFADMIRNVVGIATLAVGNIFEPDHVNTIIGAGRADLCAIARPHLADPAWTLHAAAGQRYTAQWWPQPYLPARVSWSTTSSAPPSRWAPSDGLAALRSPCRRNGRRPRHRRGDCRAIGRRGRAA